MNLVNLHALVDEREREKRAPLRVDDITPGGNHRVMRDLYHTDVSRCECGQAEAPRRHRGASDPRLGHHFEQPQGCPPEQYPDPRSLVPERSATPGILASLVQV